MSKLRYQTLRENVTKVIREKILNRELQPGMRIIEQNLSEELEVSRGPVSYTHLDVYKRQGQRGQTVNLLATPSKVRILLHPLADMILGIGQRRLLSLHCMLTKGIGTHRT